MPQPSARPFRPLWTTPGNDAYPFWATEYAYTYGDPRAGSPAAAFLRYLTNSVGQDIIRSHGDRPCAEPANPVLCRPSPAK
ncbi:hypothetical protein OG552_09070 [Streptomyces sp. NBC_01476]|uniref:hypothetical protein n=1 Tax=Streptomyces sp. NBC_01476 TaxID=2903881 RepID=UPI002E2EEFFF|nr:hypothetical protein [Streptomyces sp. NBC_01476]